MTMKAANSQPERAARLRRGGLQGHDQGRCRCLNQISWPVARSLHARSKAGSRESDFRPCTPGCNCQKLPSSVGRDLATMTRHPGLALERPCSRTTYVRLPGRAGVRYRGRQPGSRLQGLGRSLQALKRPCWHPATGAEIWLSCRAPLASRRVAHVEKATDAAGQRRY